MKKNILYVCISLALSFTACSDDPNDAVERSMNIPGLSLRISELMLLQISLIMLNSE